jgi:hypothetical protein
MAIADTAATTGKLKNGVPDPREDRAQDPLFSSPFLNEPGQDLQVSNILRQTRPRNEPGIDPNDSEVPQVSGLRLGVDNLGIGAAKVGSAGGTGVEMAGRGLEAGGSALEAGGKTAEYAGQGIEYAGKGVGALGSVAAEGGSAITKAGEGLSETGYGAIIGVPLAAVGGLVTGGGEAAKGAGKGMEVAGKGINEAGQAVNKTGQELKRAGKETKDFGGKIKDTAGKIGDRFKEDKEDAQQGSSPLEQMTDFAHMPKLGNMPGAEALTSGLLRQGKMGAALGNMDAKNTSKQKGSSRGGEFGNFDVLGEKGFSPSHMSALWQNAQAMKSSKGIRNQVKGMAVGMAKTAFSTLTSNLLRAAIENLIDSFGLTLIYINFHVLCRFVFGPEYFCKLGQEWMAGGKTGGISKAAGAEGKAASGMSSMTQSFMGIPLSLLGTAEAALLGIVDAIIIFFTLAGFTPFIIVLLIVVDPVGTFTTTLPFLYQLAVSAFNIAISKVGLTI